MQGVTLPICEKLTCARDGKPRDDFGIIPLINPDGPEAAELITELCNRLQNARDAIASLDAEALGTNQGDMQSGIAPWPIRDELLHYIDGTLTKAGVPTP